MSEVQEEIERLRLKKVELANKINFTTDFEEKEELQLQLAKIQKQIETLERFGP